MYEDEDKKSKKYVDKIKMENFIRRTEHIVGEMNWRRNFSWWWWGGGGEGVEHIFTSGGACASKPLAVQKTL